MHCAVAPHPVDIALASRPARGRAGETSMTHAVVPRPTVLVVDHHLMTGALFQAALEREGYAVELARGREQAFARIQAGGIDLVLLEQPSSDADGLNWVRRLGARKRGRYLPVIMFGERVRAAHPVARPAGGVAYYQPKPFDLPELLEQVRAWTQARKRLRTFYARLLGAAEQSSRWDYAARGSRTA